MFPFFFSNSKSKIDIMSVVTVSLTAPTDGSSVIQNNAVAISANANTTNGATIAKVEFIIDGIIVSTDTTAPYSYSTTSLGIGNHTISAKATDSNGKFSITSTITINVIASVVTVTLTNPASGSSTIQNNTVTMAATASTTGGATITQVEFIVDGSVVATDTDVPYSYDISSLTTGSHTIVARATDSNSHQASTSPITISVVASMPSITLTAPTNGSNIIENNSLVLSATASGNGGATIVNVQFFVDGTMVNTDTVAPYTYTVSSLSIGSHTIAARTLDSNGHSTITSSITVNYIASAPSVSITSPTAGFSVVSGGTITINANASSTGGATITQVQFLVDGSVVNTDSSSPYSYTYNTTGLSVASHSITAIATDSNGHTITSSAISFNVTSAVAGLIAVNSNQLFPTTHWIGFPYEMVDGNNSTAAFPGYGNYPSTVMIDLLAVHTMQKIEITPNFGTANITITGRQTYANSETPVTIFSGNIVYGTGAVVTYNTTVNVRYLYFTMNTNSANFPFEFKYYGSPLTALAVYTPYVVTSNTINKNQYGTNSYNWVPNNVHTYLKWLRNYIYIEWIAQSRNQNHFVTSAGGQFSDALMLSFKNAGYNQILCIEHAPTFIMNVNATTNDTDYPACAYNADKLDPASYVDIASIVYQIVARYSDTVVSDANLKLASDQTRLSGLNYIQYYEIGNEIDGYYRYPNPLLQRYTPQQHAAMLSACYDGHQGTMPLCGLKTASPNAKLVMSGLVDESHSYVREMILWCVDNRTDHAFVADIVNFHMYATDVTPQVNATKAISPEAYSYGIKAKRFVERVKTYIPTTSVFLTEYGADSNNSTNGPLDFADNLKADVQAGWSLRTLMDCATSGIDVFTAFNMMDNNGTSVTDSTIYNQYIMCGFTGSQNAGYPDKPAAQVYKRYMDLLGSGNWNVTKDTSNNHYQYVNGTDTLDFYYNRSITIAVEGGKTKTSIQMNASTTVETPITTTTTFNNTSEIPIVIHTHIP